MGGGILIRRQPSSRRCGRDALPIKARSSASLQFFDAQQHAGPISLERMTNDFRLLAEEWWRSRRRRIRYNELQSHRFACQTVIVVLAAIAASLKFSAVSRSKPDTFPTIVSGPAGQQKLAVTAGVGRRKIPAQPPEESRRPALTSRAPDGFAARRVNRPGIRFVLPTGERCRSLMMATPQWLIE